jgi:hypothetical protein
MQDICLDHQQNKMLPQIVRLERGLGSLAANMGWLNAMRLYTVLSGISERRERAMGHRCSMQVWT